MSYDNAVICSPVDQQGHSILVTELQWDRSFPKTLTAVICQLHWFKQAPRFALVLTFNCISGHVLPQCQAFVSRSLLRLRGDNTLRPRVGSYLETEFKAPELTRTKKLGGFCSQIPVSHIIYRHASFLNCKASKAKTEKGEEGTGYESSDVWERRTREQGP